MKNKNIFALIKDKRYKYQTKALKLQIQFNIVSGFPRFQFEDTKISLRVIDYKQKIIMLENLIGKKLKNFIINSHSLGQGQYGIVVEGIDVRNQEKVAIKIIMIKNAAYQKIKKDALAQISILSLIKNENVIRYIDSFETSQFFFIVTEYCNGGDLHDYLLSNEPDQEQALVMLKQILHGFKGLHEAGIMHRDLKPANILLHDGVCKIADFGLSENVGVGNKAHGIVGTPLTNAPEQLAGEEYGFEVDIWSIGAVYYRILYGEYPFNASDAQMIQHLMNTTEPDYQLNGKEISPQSIDFIKRCLQSDPNKRMKWPQIYRHPLITGKPEPPLSPFSLLTSQTPIQQTTPTPTTTTAKTTTKVDEDLLSILKFYQTTPLVEKVPDINIFQLLRGIVKVQVEEVQSQDREKVRKFEKEQERLRMKKEIVGRFEGLYMKKREDILFFVKFIHPHIKKVSYIRANHAVAGFILSKKSYSELTKYHKALAQKKPQFPKQANFQQFISYPQYSQLLKKSESDLQTLEQINTEYKRQIKLTTLEIQQQFDIKTIKSWNFDGLTKGIVKEYLRLLYQGVKEVKEKKEKGDKKDLLRLIMALEYYGDTERVYAQKFQRILSKTDFEMQESKIISKIM